MNRNVIEDARMQQKALEFQAQLMAKLKPGKDPVQPAAEGRAGRGGSRSAAGQKKIAGSPAAARAPEAAARPEPEKTRPNRLENEFMMNLMILRNSLHRNAPACRERARRAGKWVWRDIRLMMTLVDRIQNALLTTMPKSRDEYYSAYAVHGHYELHIDGPVRTARHLLITDKHLAAMAEAAMKSECVLCMREGSEIGQCPLREALLETAVPTEVQDGIFRKCEYRDAAGQLILGKDVTV